MTDSASARWTTSPADRVGPEVGDGDLGRQRSRRRERTDVLGRLVGRAGARLPETLDERVEEARRHLVTDLDLELAESEAATREPFGTETASSTTPAMSRPSASCISVRRRIVVMCTLSASSLAANEPAHELDRCRRRAVAVAVEHDLGPDEEGRVALGGKLDGPALAGTVAQARPPAREAEVGGVVVRRLVALGRRLPDDRRDEPVDARHLEVRRRGELQLAFGAVLHGRLSVALSARGRRGASLSCPRANASRAKLGTRAGGRSAKL